MEKVYAKGRRRGPGDRVNRCREKLRPGGKRDWYHSGESWTTEKKAIDPAESIEHREDCCKKGVVAVVTVVTIGTRREEENDVLLSLKSDFPRLRR